MYVIPKNIRPRFIFQTNILHINSPSRNFSRGDQGPREGVIHGLGGDDPLPPFRGVALTLPRGQSYFNVKTRKTTNLQYPFRTPVEPWKILVKNAFRVKFTLSPFAPWRTFLRPYKKNPLRNAQKGGFWKIAFHPHPRPRWGGSYVPTYESYKEGSREGGKPRTSESVYKFHRK